jgi:uncharacterized membrane protein YkoI
MPFAPRLAVFAAALLLAAPAAFARHDYDDARRLQEAGQILPLERLIEAARTQHAGRVIETELKGRHGCYVYEIEIVDEQGVVWEMHYDAATGKFIGENRKADGSD